MKKGLLIVALAALLVLPMTVFAGMWSITDNEMEDVTGQTGINIDMSLEVTSGYVAYGDEDGGGATYTSGGYFTMSGMTFNDGAGGAVDLSGLTIDVGSAGSVGALIIGLPGISGELAYTALKLGSAADAGGSLGSLTMGDLGTDASTITVTPK